MNTTAPSSVTQATRIEQLDILRGFALLGILLMNIQSFSMPGAAYLNPTAWGSLEGANFWVWSISNVLADSKFMGLFSILFGAGICLFAQRAEEKTGGSASLHYQRNAWLLLFGLIHAHFIWYGDILYSYALCSFWVYWFRNKSTTTLIILSILFASIASLYSLFVHFALNNNYIPPQEVTGILKFWAPTAEQLNADIQAYTGSFVAQLQQRSNEAFFLETQVFLSTFIWRAGAMMLLGMALYKSGVLIGQKSQSYYLKLTVIGLLIGVPLSIYGMQQNLAHDFTMNYSMFLGSQFNYWGSIFTALGYIGLLNLLINKGMWLGLQKRLASVGQMAFSNYIFHSVFCTFIFYGIGLGLYSEVQRTTQLLIVFFVWALQLWYSPLWLSKFRFGPLEWLWRSLTYRKRQPMHHVA